MLRTLLLSSESSMDIAAAGMTIKAPIVPPMIAHAEEVVRSYGLNQRSLEAAMENTMKELPAAAMICPAST